LSSFNCLYSTEGFLVSQTTNGTWSENVKAYFDKRVATMLLFGFSAGLPILMIFSSLSLWLREAGVKRGAVTYFSWAALGYSFKFIWAPLVDKLPIPVLTNLLGRRKSWLLFSQGLIITAICWMALVDPSAGGNSLTYMALAAVMLGFSSATQDIVIDAFRIESAEAKMQAILSSVYIAGYRVAMIVSGAGAIALAQYLGSTKAHYSYDAWKWSYLAMAGCMLVGVVTTFASPEPELEDNNSTHSTKDYAQFFILFLIIVFCFVGVFYLTSDVTSELKKKLVEIFNNKALAGLIVGTLRLTVSVTGAGIVAFLIGKTGIVNTGMVEEGYISPIKNFFERYGKNMAILLLTLIGLYRISDIVLGVISNVFYQDLGFSKAQIASVVKTFGLIMSLLGGFLGGLLTTRFGVIRLLFWGAILSSATNLLFMLLAKMGANLPMLYLVISADNLAAGLASAAFVAFLSSLTDISFTAVQFAIFTSLMTLLPKVMGGYSGSMVDAMGYSGFFAMTAIIGLPVIYVVWLCGKKFQLKE
jgi:MFS transporter, PAT family, beta-lactamase induction signal transducer AmpG